MASDITIIVVTYNSAHIIGDMILGLPRDYGVIVVDNHSNDGTCEIVESIDRDNVLLLRNLRNVGYGAGNNVGLRACKTRYALVMNPDAMISADNVEKLRQALESDEHAVLAGPISNEVDSKTYYPHLLFDRDMPLLRSPRNRFVKSIVEIPDMNICHYTGVLMGFLLLYDLRKMSDIVYFDENIFLYHEEAEFIYRINLLGYHALLVPYAEVSHLRGMSSCYDGSQLADLWYRTYYLAYAIGYLCCKYEDKVPLFDRLYYAYRIRRNALLARFFGKSIEKLVSYYARIEGHKDALKKFSNFSPD